MIHRNGFRRIRGRLIGETATNERVGDAGNRTPGRQGVRLSWKMWLEMTMRWISEVPS